MSIIPITDLSIPELAMYSRQSERALLHYFEPDHGVFIAESITVIENALNAGYRPISLLLEEKHVTGDGASIVERCSDIPIYTSDMETLSSIAGFELTRGALCAMRRHVLPDAEAICRNGHRIAVLGNVMNPTNIGAIFRSAAALNLDAILLSSGCCDPLYRRAIRVSMGTVFQIPWTFLNTSETEWPHPAISFLQKLGYKTAAMALCENTLSISDPGLKNIDKLAVILGTEGDGLAPSTIKACDYTVKIPMAHNVDSLNVAAASAVAFWELRYRE